jgi:recombination protein RecT
MTDVRTSSSTALAERDSSPRGMIEQYRNDFAAVLPTHVKASTWVRISQGALKKGKKGANGRYELEIAAENNIGLFLATLMDAARLGLEPGTEQYYLTPRLNKGKLEILGIVGYQGYIELMYRAGAISSVIAECVYAADQFDYQPGTDAVPRHVIDWDAEDRGPLRLVYAYAKMKDGATSKVIVLNRAAIKTIKASAKGSDTAYSPWQTNEASMWLKSAVRQLQKWVPTPSEIRGMPAAATLELATVRNTFEPSVPIAEFVENVDTGEVIEGEWVDEDQDAAS